MIKQIERGDKELKTRYDALLRDCNHDLAQLRAEFDEQVSDNFASLVSRVTTLEKKTNALCLKGASKTQVLPPSNNKNNNEELKRLSDRLNSLVDDFSNLKVDVQNGFTNVSGALDRKADLEFLKE